MSQLILIADGDAEAGERLDVHLRREGFRTVGAMDGQAALVSGVFGLHRLSRKRY